MIRKLQRGLVPLFVFGVTGSAIGVFYLGLVALDAINARYELPLLFGRDFTSMIIVPIGIAGINFVILIVEWLNVGWRKSALKRLLFLETRTVRNDFFYLFLRLSGFQHAVCFFVSFGFVFVAARQLGEALDFDVLAYAPNLGAQFAVVVLVNSFTFYWAHRFKHTHTMFEIHKVHHSAEELNILTATRNHPADFFIMILVNTIPASILGADPLVVTAYLGLNGLYQCAANSGITFLESKPFRFFIITPLAHRVHHSNLERHYDLNFGILTLWDRLFGTYYYPVDENEFTLGVKDKADFNTDRPMREMWLVFVRWLVGQRRRFGGARD